MGVQDFDLEAYLARLPSARQSGSGAEWLLPCPVCAGHEHLHVNTDKRCAHCFRCGWRAGLLSLLAALEGRTPAEVGRRIGRDDRGNADLEATRARVLSLGARVPLPPTPAAISLPDAFIPLGQSHGPEIERHLKPFRTYLAHRGIPADLIAHHGIGCALAGRYAARVLFPVYADGRLVAFQARDITGRSAAKYIGPPGVRLGEALFNLDHARQHERIVLSEGIISAIRTGPDAVACFGKVLSPAQVALLAQARRSVVVLFDGEKAATGARAAGAEAAHAAAALKQAGVSSFVAQLPCGDPAELPLELVRRVITEALPADGLASLRAALHSRAAGHDG